jgi:hypothetical protein
MVGSKVPGPFIFSQFRGIAEMRASTLRRVHGRLGLFSDSKVLSSPDKSSYPEGTSAGRGTCMGGKSDQDDRLSANIFRRQGDGRDLRGGLV